MRGGGGLYLRNDLKGYDTLTNVWKKIKKAILGEGEGGIFDILFLHG